MPREIDVRREQGRPGRAGVRAGAVVPERREALQTAAEEASARLPGDHEVRVVSFDTDSGGAAVLVSDDAPAGEGDYVTRALQHVQVVGDALGLTPGQPVEYVADPGYQTTSTGGVAVHLRQQLKGVPVYDAAETVRFGTDGRLTEVAGRTYPVGEDLAVSPRLTAADALDAAARHLATAEETTPGETPVDAFGEPATEPVLDLTEFSHRLVTVAQDSPDLPTVFEATGLDGPVTVSLIWFPLEDTLRLAWHLRAQVVGGPEYRVVVDAADGRTLLARRLTRGLGGRAQIVLAAGGPRTAVVLPLAADSYGPPLPPDLPDSWPDPWLVDDTTSGSCVRAVNAGSGDATVAGSRQGEEVVFAAPTQVGSDDQLVVNLFAFCSAMHDALYLVGFREADGNFQRDSMGRGGRPGDAVLAKVHPGSVWGTANMGTRSDGLAPLMNMGLVTSTGRHTALDPDVVYHEYVHGLTNRLVGGPMNDTALDAEQSGGMGEGWSDYVACTLLGKTVVGDWVVDRSVGIRRQPYTDDYVGTYADVGTPDYSQVHDIGELWCAVLMSLGRRIGTWECLQVVVDALKLTSANPSLLAARDAILFATRQRGRVRGDDDAVAEVVHAAWEVFARYGMGPAARTDGAALTGIVADFDPPPRPSTSTVRGEAGPGLPIPDDDVGGAVSTVSLPEAGPVRGLVVSVDVAHTYRGDLVVTLQAPDGRTVVLQERTGGREQDLHETWDARSFPPLQELYGLGSGGSWSLRVADHAAVDVGTLRRWSLEAEVGERRPTVHAVAAPGLTIPDDDKAGVRVPLVVRAEGTVSDVVLSVDITHTHVGDLIVALRAPTGKRLTVHRRRGGDADNLIASYGSGPDQPLEPFVGLGAAGTWTLEVSDREGRDLGKLNRGSLTLGL
ncbi:M36 family metallopeptidase [Jannaschia sp. R86511]|uniref:M36 family metallopeptidase n=1 Tax=Jannaschia sp. R86511 TaxID=3093853 RepID=UPI0036D3461B